MSASRLPLLVFSATMFAQLFKPRIGLKALFGLSHRLGMMFGAGLDLRSILEREAQQAAGPLKRHLEAASLAVKQGASFSDGIALAGDFFPPLFQQLIELGEKTGELDSVLKQLAEHYQHQLQMRRSFLASLAWPLTQLGIALFVIGFLIWIMGVINRGQENFDLLGFGLMGNRGLGIYVGFLSTVGISIWLLIRAIRRRLFWTKSIQYAVLQLPLIGKPLKTLALARLAWSMRLTFNTGMNVIQAIKLSLQSTQNFFYTDQIPLFERELSKGNSLAETFSQAGGFPTDFLHTIDVGERSGRIVEAMDSLARNYLEQARFALAQLSSFAGWGVWLLVAIFIIVIIFRIFSFYLSAIGSAMPF